MGDLFDKSPREWTRKPSAVARQKRLVAKIHAAGAQVVMSSHPLCFLEPEEVLAQLKDFAKRGADVVKLVPTLRRRLRLRHQRCRRRLFSAHFPRSCFPGNG